MRVVTQVAAPSGAAGLHAAPRRMVRGRAFHLVLPRCGLAIETAAAEWRRENSCIGVMGLRVPGTDRSGKDLLFPFPGKSGKSLSVFLNRLRVRLTVDKLALSARLNQPGFEQNTQVV